MSVEQHNHCIIRITESIDKSIKIDLFLPFRMSIESSRQDSYVVMSRNIFQNDIIMLMIENSESSEEGNEEYHQKHENNTRTCSTILFG